MNTTTTPKTPIPAADKTEHTPGIIQEIKDLFAANSGDYTPTQQEIEAIDQGLNALLIGMDTAEYWHNEWKHMSDCYSKAMQDLKREIADLKAKATGNA